MTSEQLEQHSRAAYKLDQIMQAAFTFIRHNAETITEYQVAAFIKQRLIANNLKSDTENPIVSFGENTAQIHYFPTEKHARQLKQGNMIMIDLWARIEEKGAPFADITWMGVNGRGLLKRESIIFDHILTARNLAISYIKEELGNKRLPILGEIDLVARRYFEKYHLEQHFRHTTGHPIGTISAHGRQGGSIWHKNGNKAQTNIPYTIEPGLYFKNDFGVRSEIDFFIDENFELSITTTPQKEIVRV